MGKFSTLILTIGIPSSGKSTWVRKYVQEHKMVHVISTDAIRQELFGYQDPPNSEEVHKEALKRAKSYFEDPANNVGLGPEVIIDATNVDVEEWKRYKALNTSVMYAKIFDISPAEAMERQLVGRKERIVPYEVIERKYKQLQENKKYIPFYFNMIVWF